MISAAFIHTITITGRTKTGTGPYGGDVYSNTTVYSDIPARVEYPIGSNKTEYRSTGQRLAPEIIVYIEADKTNVNEQQEVTFNGVVIGRIIGISNALKGISDEIDHIELNLEPV